jgi:hypothetical protein
MRLLVLVACGLILLNSATLAAPTTGPASAPSTQTLADGAISFIPPSGWTQAGKAANGRTLAYVQLQPIKATMAVNADHQQSPLDEAAAQKIGQMQCKRIIDNAPKSNVEIIDQPTVEKDQRFFLRIHHRFRKGESVGDQLQLYRVFGQELVAVAVTAYTDSPDDAKPIFNAAEQVMSSVHGSGAGATAAGPTTSSSTKAPQLSAKPITLSHAKLRLAPPEGWRADLNDAASGMVATFHDPADETNLVAISVRQLPKEAKADPKMRDALLDEMASGETAQLKVEGAEPVGQTVNVVDRRFLHKTRTRYRAKADGRQFDISSRQVRAGDEIVSVSVVSLEDKFDLIDKLADQVALSVRAAAAR